MGASSAAALTRGGGGGGGGGGRGRGPRRAPLPEVGWEELAHDDAG